MAWEDTNKGHIELLIENQKWREAYNALQAYIRDKGEDYWAKSNLALVKSNL